MLFFGFSSPLILLFSNIFHVVLWSQMLLQFLRAVTKASDFNKMTLNSVAMIIAPNLFIVGTSPPGSSGARRIPKRIRYLLELTTAAGISSLVRLVIFYQDLLWQVRLSVIVEFCFS